MNQYKGAQDYAIWNEKALIADCLHRLGLKTMAEKIHTENVNGDIMTKYINLVKSIAEQRQDIDVLDRLCFAGLIYG